MRIGRIAMDAKEVRDQAMKLPAGERAALAEDLWASLDEGSPAEIEAAWLAEAEKRREAYKRGEMPSVSLETAIRDARARLR